jgi:hypothetical protein
MELLLDNGEQNHMKNLTCFATFILACLLLANPTKAAIYVVVNTNDSGTGSLREAINQANTTPVEDTIVFDTAIFSTPQVITLTTGQLAPFYSLTIEGPGANLLTISGNNQSRIFFSNFGETSLSIRNLTLTDGSAVYGGAIYSSNTLRLNRVSIVGNKAVGAEITQTVVYGGLGGGIFSEGTLVLSNSIVSNNLASGILGVNTTNPNFGDGGTFGGGGGVFARGFDTTIVNCTFNGNTAKGISSPPAPDNRSGAGGGDAYGGAIYGIFGLKITNSTFTNNSAIAGNGGSIMLFALSAGKGGEAYGGAIFSSRSRILNTTFNNNTAIAGNGGNAEITNNAGNGGDCFGGAIIDYDLKIANSTVVNNSVTSGSGRNGGNSYGGGIHGGGNEWSVVNSTITGNAVSGGTGLQTNGLVRGGGVYSTTNTGQISSFHNNIVAENTAPIGTDIFGTYINAKSNLIRIGEITTSITNGLDGNIVGNANSPLNPILATLADNGGITKTRALLAGSPAINTGTNAFAINPLNLQTLQYDQRSLQRINPVGGVIDIGAYELGSFGVPVTGVPDLRNTSDTGLNDTDNITTATMPVFDVTNVIPGAKVELLRNNSVVSSIDAITFTAILIDNNPPLDGVVTYTVRQIVGSNTSGVSLGLNVTFDHTSPNFTINQSSTQLDPATTLPIRFTAVFNEPVGGLEGSDISLTGSTANVTNAFVSINATSTTTFDIEISGIGSPGQISITIPAGAAYDYVLNPSNAPTYIDNSVTFQPSIVGVSISGRIRRTSSITKVPSRVTLFDTFTGESWSTQTNQLGYYRFFGTPIYQQIGRRFTVRVDNKSFVYIAPSPVLITGNRVNLNFTAP